MIFKPRKTEVREETSSSQKSSTSVQIDEDLQKRAEQNYVRALMLASMRTPTYSGPVVADMTRPQYAAMDSTARGARSMGIDVRNPARPNTVTSGGVRGMSATPIFNEAVGALPQSYVNDVNAFYEQLARSVAGGS